VLELLIRGSRHGQVNSLSLVKKKKVGSGEKQVEQHVKFWEEELCKGFQKVLLRDDVAPKTSVPPFL